MVKKNVEDTLDVKLFVIAVHLHTDPASGATGVGSTKTMLQNIYRQQGIKGLFAGLVPRLAKVMPACAIMISTYEYAKRILRKRSSVVDTWLCLVCLLCYFKSVAQGACIVICYNKFYELEVSCKVRCTLCNKYIIKEGKHLNGSVRETYSK